MLIRQRAHRLARSCSHGWGMPSNRSSRAGRSIPSRAQPPDIAGVLGVPAAALGQVRDARGRRSPAAAARCPSGRPQRGTPLAPVPARPAPAARSAPLAASTLTDGADVRGLGLDLPSSWRRCSGVLQLQLQLPGQAMPGRTLDSGVGRRTRQSTSELADVGSPSAFQRGGGFGTEREVPCGPQVAVAISAQTACPGVARRRPGLPASRTGPGCPARSQSLACGRTGPAGDAEPQPVTTAAGQLGLRAMPCHGGSWSQANRRRSGRPAACHRSWWPLHKPAGCAAAGAAGHPAGATAEHRVRRARRPGCRPGTPGGPPPSACPAAPAADGHRDAGGAVTTAPPVR